MLGRHECGSGEIGWDLSSGALTSSATPAGSAANTTPRRHRGRARLAQTLGGLTLQPRPFGDYPMLARSAVSSASTLGTGRKQTGRGMAPFAGSTADGYQKAALLFRRRLGERPGE